MLMLSGCSEAWYRAWFGTMRPKVQILSLRFLTQCAGKIFAGIHFSRIRRRETMTSEERRVQIEGILNNNTEPVTASYFAKEFSVSRQVIVGDIALMRAGGLKISATPRGYVLDREEDSQCVFTVACCHDEKTMGDELYAIVDNGGIVHDVIVEHAIYGELIGELHLQSRYDVELFLKKVAENKVQPLLRLTDGIHLHTIKCKDEETKKRIINILKLKKILLDQ